MYRFARCGGIFGTFVTPGQCPLCGGWADVRCLSCGHTGAASVFVAQDRVTGVGILLLLTSCCMRLSMWDEIQRGGCLLLFVLAATAGAVAALVWGLKGRMPK